MAGSRWESLGHVVILSLGPMLRVVKCCLVHPLPCQSLGNRPFRVGDQGAVKVPGWTSGPWPPWPESPGSQIADTKPPLLLQLGPKEQPRALESVEPQ